MQRLFLLLFIGVIAFALWLYYIDPGQTWDGIKSTNLLYLSVGYVMLFISYSFKILRWSLILKKVKRIPFLQVVKYYWACEFANNFVPGRIGELSNSLLLKKNYEIAISASMSAMIVDRFFGIIVRLAVIGFIPFVAHEMYPYLKNYLIYVACLLTLIIVFFILLIKSTRNFIKLLNKLLFFLPESWTQRILSFVENTIVTIKKTHFHKLEIFIFLGISILSLLAQAWRTYYFFKAVGIELPIGIYVLTTTIMDFLLILPSPPASLGTTEWYTNIIYTFGLGISKNKVAGIAVLTHAITLCFIAILGLISLSSIGYGFFKIGKSESRGYE
jgi:uncharacterized protein (TIRG00374 family)